MGRVSASSILRRLGTYSRKNSLYKAFCELGRVVRTIFLLKYISDPSLRSTIQAATCKSESFNDLIKWIRFGGDETLKENDRDKQRKLIKYNHLAANLIIFHNVCTLTRLLNELAKEGFEFDEETIAAISPYIREHINRFGAYILNLARKHALPSHTVALKRKKFAKAGGDVKATGLKELQGLIWQQGYESGLLKSHVYHDVPPALEGWKELGLNISIYSSGSIHAQKLFFANTEYGDLTNYFDRYYDTTSGAKIFLSNVPAELSAAIAAGLQAVLLARPGNTFADWNGAIANSFADLEIAMSVATPG